MRYLGLDLGSKTLGISLSDATKTIASSYKTIFFEKENYESLIPIIQDIVKKCHVNKIILGFPKNMNNSVGERGEITLSFKKRIEDEIGIEVVMQDERLSTKEATSYMIQADISRKKRKKKIDSVAASIILQTYLDKERKNQK